MTDILIVEDNEELGGLVKAFLVLMMSARNDDQSKILDWMSERTITLRNLSRCLFSVRRSELY